jgi:hypothetical protein
MAASAGPLPSRELVPKSKSHDVLALRKFVRRLHAAYRLRYPHRKARSNQRRLSWLSGRLNEFLGRQTIVSALLRHKVC